MRCIEVRVSFEKRLSDGNFGGENARVELVALLESEDSEPLDIIDLLLAQARARVLADLCHSTSSTIRRQAEPQPATSALEPTPFDEFQAELAP